MLDPDGLNVWSGQRLVGHLWRNVQGAMGFSYDDAWRESNGYAISNTLPLRSGDFRPEDAAAHRFFANLLPEGGVRDQIVRDLKIPNTDFDLLRAIGGECAGALSILQAEYQPTDEYEYLKLSEQEVARLVARRGHVATWSANDRPRLSLAGAQDKCPVLYKDGCYWLPERESPSSHILKFEVAGYRHLPAYETFTTMLAQAAGLPVVDIQLCCISDAHFARIERYDRLENEAGKIQRLHQEDFCQALGFGSERKYQEYGGPSFADCYRLVQEVSSDPAIDLLNLLRWQIFNVLAGNSDGHAKNLSLLYRQGGEIRLAPFYDLVCTRAIERIDYHLAFAVGDERNPGVVASVHWEALAKQCGVRPRFLLEIVGDVASRLLENLLASRERFEHFYGEYAALQRIEQVVVQQCRRALLR